MNYIVSIYSILQSCLSQLQGILTFSGLASTKASQDLLNDITALGLSRGALSNLATNIRNIGSINIVGTYRYNNGIQLVSMSAPMAKVKKMIVEIEYISTSGANALLDFTASMTNNPSFLTTIFCRNTQGNTINSLSMAKNTRVLLIFDLVICPFMSIRMSALPVGFVVNGADELRVNNVIYQF